MYAKAYANNDVAIILWQYDGRINDCLGFQIERIDTATGQTTLLPAWVGFVDQTNKNWEQKDTSIWPVQKYNWKDVTAPKNREYQYRITPMLGTENNLTASTVKSQILLTNKVSISPGSGDIKAYFNRGILSTQFVARSLPSGKNGPSKGALIKEISDPTSKLRKSLTGDLKNAIVSLLQKAIDEGGKVYGALYELTDQELVDKLKEAKDYVELIVSNADGSRTSTDENGKKHKTVLIDEENKKCRKDLKDAGVIIYDRFVPSRHIGHDKFLVYEDPNGKRRIVLSGSTNFTPTGLCAQSNNAIEVAIDEIAEIYYQFWLRLKDDTDNYDSKQGASLRKANNKRYSSNSSGNDVGVWFSPNTPHAGKPPGTIDIENDPNQPSDLNEVFRLMGNAKKSILFLLFQPGNPSILDKALTIQQTNPGIFVRGAATDPKAVADFNTALFHGNSAVPDFYNVVAAAAIKDPIGYWEKELLSGGCAIIHSKIVVIDAFTDDCVVITGSHNLGYKASYDNDENMLIIKGNRELADAYAAHVIDVYDHYRWRYMLLSKGHDEKGNFLAFNGLATDDSWQDKYFNKPGKGKTVKPTKEVTFANHP